MKAILDPLCRDVETDLRLHIHSHLAVSDRNPFKTGVKDLAKFLNIKPLRFFEETIDIKGQSLFFLSFNNFFSK